MLRTHHHIDCHITVVTQLLKTINHFQYCIVHPVGTTVSDHVHASRHRGRLHFSSCPAVCFLLACTLIDR